jgi:hypothetical protein
VMGGGLPQRGGILRPLTESRRGGTGASVCGRDGAHHGGTSARCGSVWESCSGDDGRHHGAHRALEEEEAGLLHLEVSSRSSKRSDFEGLELNFVPLCSQGGADCPRTRAR